MIFLGHVSKDINVVKGIENIVPGGGALYGAFTARSLGEPTTVITKVAQKDRKLFEDMEGFGIDVIFLDSKETTSIKNVYPSENPDERTSTVVSRADPFSREDLESLKDILTNSDVHLTPLWYGEFPEDLIPVLREYALTLSGDAQGFLRHVEDGKMVYRDWKRKDEFLKLFDVFKLDSKEAKILTGTDDPKEVFRILQDLGLREIVMTRSDGVHVMRDGEITFAPFGNWTLEGRTGRGDTCIASYLVLRKRKRSLKELTEVVALIATKKMQRPGPYRGW